MPGGKQTVLKNFLLTCEHGGNEVPTFLKGLVKIPPAVLKSHRGLDLGALHLFRELLPMADFAISATTTRLVVDLNRSLHHRNLFSEYTKGLSETVKKSIVERLYTPYRSQVEDWVRAKVEGETGKRGNGENSTASASASALKKGRTHSGTDTHSFSGEGKEGWVKGKGEGEGGKEVVHISIHTFTPVLRGQKRNASIGFLYDPSRKEEVALSKRIASALKANRPELVLRMNYPYKGTSDGFTTYLRKKYKSYSGIEIEVNQKQVSSGRMEEGLVRDISLAVLQVLGRR